MKPEERVEKHLARQVRDAGGICIKFAPTVAGVPDRLVILPGGRVHLVELKAPGGRLRPIQVVWHRRVLKVGYKVPVLSSVADVDSWLTSVL